ncbi:MAG: polysaccharide deacetylase family protein [Burkholderiales bacterium]
MSLDNRTEQAMKLALKIDVDTLRGTLEGVPRLLGVLDKHQTHATFLFSLGPDHTGRAIKRVFRPGFMKKVSRTSVVEHYGIKTLLYGTLLPGPDIGKRGADIMLSVRNAGHECGIHTYDHIKWQDNVANQDEAWTEREMQKAFNRFAEIFSEPARTHGAAGWQMNRYAYRMEQRLGFDYCSDGRGKFPYIPMIRGEVVPCPQLPTTLPTLDELIGVDGITAENVAEHILNRTRDLHVDQVYTLHAELEGMKLLPAFDALLSGWREQGFELCTTAELFRSLDGSTLPYCEVGSGEVPGRSGKLAVQGKIFLADA